MDYVRLDFLLNKYFDNNLEVLEKEELERVLQSSPQVRVRFWEQARFHALLRRLGEENWGKRMASLADAENHAPAGLDWEDWRRVLKKLAVGLRRHGGWAIAAAALVLLLFDSPARSLLPARAVEERTTSGIAVLTRAVDAVWVEGSAAHRAGVVLERGWLKLKSGLVQVEFNSGASLIVEGPAELQLVSGEEGVCRSGRLTAQVPIQAPDSGSALRG